MKKLFTVIAFLFVVALPTYSQVTLEQSLIALKGTDEHDKIKINDERTEVTFENHIPSIEGFEPAYLSVELAIELYTKMKDPMIYGSYFDAIYKAGMTYKSVSKSSNGYEICITANTKGIGVEIIDDTKKSLTNDYFPFDN
ncbi:hypothetical protein [Flammeovirga kamogawensis]|uniref:DUF4430 domain-containing protein n=1 Tax=Flammeovirga kamogawensis TaxID=373891 RepID=A0ABX8H0F5_9BACT|nr:hypothetical protein [Flammeovirga kamogawensis]MBB6462223.1 hypothetical protein [Flammeovirga kamogawensis]QWG09376.1 hypothetical protein KM029_22480 [Flammeovirga kamogawensis]TRX64894.1 hypothetical protein EO216_20390 [Flammeovirga kamogawensis]